MTVTCPHPRHAIRKIGDKLWKCLVCNEWRGTQTLAEYCDMRWPPSLSRAEADRIANGGPSIGKAPKAESWK